MIHLSTSIKKYSEKEREGYTYVLQSISGSVILVVRLHSWGICLALLWSTGNDLNKVVRHWHIALRSGIEVNANLSNSCALEQHSSLGFDVASNTNGSHGINLGTTSPHWITPPAGLVLSANSTTNKPIARMYEEEAIFHKRKVKGRDRRTRSVKMWETKW